MEAWRFEWFSMVFYIFLWFSVSWPVRCHKTMEPVAGVAVLRAPLLAQEIRPGPVAYPRHYVEAKHAH